MAERNAEEVKCKEALQGINTTFKSIEKSLVHKNDARNHQVILLQHVARCSPYSCTLNWCPSNEINRRIKNTFQSECDNTDNDAILTALFLHSLNCNLGVSCGVYNCVEVRKCLIDHDQLLRSNCSGSVVFSETSWFDVGDIVNISIDYKIMCEVEIARGAYGDVRYQWLARNQHDVALAVKHASYNPNNEIKVASHIASRVGSHPHLLMAQLILKLVDAGSDSCLLFMQKGDCTLLEYTQAYKIDYHENIKADVAMIFIKQLLSALSCIHEQNLIHCDIKGKNIVLADGFQRLLLIDFDCITVNGDTERNLKECFTYGYAPPEVFQSENIEPLSSLDIYSFGVTVAEIFCGEMENRRNRDPDFYLLMIRHRDEQIVNYLERCYPFFARFVADCLQVNAELRPSADILLLFIENDHNLSMYARQSTSIPPVKINGIQPRGKIEQFLRKKMVSHMNTSLEKHLPIKRSTELCHATLMDLER